MKQYERPRRIIIAAGGTGGHLFPALAIAEELKKMQPDVEITFVGTKKRIEGKIIPERGYPFYAITISGLRRGINLQNLLLPVKIPLSLYQSYTILKRLKPDVVVGAGGYVSAPVVGAAVGMGMPTLIHEQNSFPGITTRILASKVDQVHVSYDETKKYLKRVKSIQTSGNPTSSMIGAVQREDALLKYGFNRKYPVLLAFGGSLGAATLNNAILAAMSLIDKRKIQLIWSTGESMYEEIKAKLKEREGIIVTPFINDIATAYAAATLALTRSGATTVAELTHVGLPAILVPYPYAAARHQEFNAKVLSDKGAAIIVSDKDLEKKLPEMIENLLDSPDRLEQMSREARNLSKPDAGKIIAGSVLRLAGKETDENVPV